MGRSQYNEETLPIPEERRHTSQAGAMKKLVGRRPPMWLLLCWPFFLNGSVGGEEAGPPVDFSRDVKPILSRHCYACHGPDESSGGLSLHTRAAAFTELDSGERALVAGDPERSQLLFRVVTDDESLRMPLEEPPLSAAEVDVLRRWIEQGAGWREHWAFEPRRRPPVPAVPAGGWSVHPIDRFIGQRLQEQQLSPAAPASARALVRRIYFDLTGLPPSPDDITAFVSGPAIGCLRTLGRSSIGVPAIRRKMGPPLVGSGTLRRNKQF